MPVQSPFPDRETLRDKILGCWIGKNCGGTLGAPLEKAFSEEEPFDVSYYPVIKEGGIPNDDLEIQLAWLKALEETGLGLTANDLASYWLDHVGYNPDEYGLMKTNLRLGLRPPVSGFYNNYFKHSMGCPIRTEIWACIAPGNPRLAARYSIEDSICDHGGGESINGSLFNVTIEAAAFVLTDRAELIEIGLSYLPENSITARCIRAAIKAHQDGEEWLAARRRVLEIGGSINAMYSPPNIAFQVIGWLYGTDFGDSLCKAVNCGYDTDCTGATLGSILGILGGTQAIPEKWKAPLGDAISTSDSTGGVRHFYRPPCPVPETITELTERVLKLQRKVEAVFGPPSNDVRTLYADEATRALALESPTRITFPLPPKTTLAIDYLGSPQINPQTEQQILVEASHSGPDPISVAISPICPADWTCTPSQIEGMLPAEGKFSSHFTLRAPGRAHLENSNEILFHIRPARRPGWGAMPLAMIGAPAYLRSERYSPGAIHQTFAPESCQGDVLAAESRGTGWVAVYADGNDVGACLPGFAEGVIYLRGFLKSASDRTVWMHACSTVPAKVWINGTPTFGSDQGRRFRPWSRGYQESELEGEISLRQGWNEVLLKFAAGPSEPAFQCHVLYSDHRDQFAGITDLLWTRFPWDEKG